MADLILAFHFLYVSFVVGGFFLIWTGFFLQWVWVRNFRFRVLHLAAMGIVAVESILGMRCPLTTWENGLRSAGAAYETSFMQHWIHAILFYRAPACVFTLIYVVFCGLLAATWLVVRPSRLIADSNKS